MAKLRFEEDDAPDDPEPDNTDLAAIIDAEDEDEDDDDLEDNDDEDEDAFARGERGATLRSRQDLPRSDYEVL